MNKLMEAITTKQPIDLQVTDTANFPISFRLHLDTTHSKNFIIFLQVVFEAFARQPFLRPPVELSFETSLPRSIFITRAVAACVAHDS